MNSINHLCWRSNATFKVHVQGGTFQHDARSACPSTTRSLTTGGASKPAVNNRLNGFIRNVCGHVSWYHLHCAPKMHAGGNADPRKDANANAIMARAEWDANAWGALPETAPPLASSYGWRNRYVRIPSAICGSLDYIAG